MNRKQEQEQEQETREGAHDPQQHINKPAAQTHGEPKSDLIAQLLRDRLATKLTEDELTSLVSEVTMLAKETTSHSASVPEKPLKYKWEIERALRATDRHVRPRDHERRERVFRDRSPLGVMTFDDLSDGLMYGGLNPVSSTLTSTRISTAVHRSRNPWLDRYFS